MNYNKSLDIDTQLITEKIEQFIFSKLKNSGLKGGVVAVSGGIDSALTLLLTVRALGSKRVRAITMPERDITPRSDIDDVMRLTEMCDVTCDVVEITPVLRVMRSSLPLYDSSDLVPSGNIKARIRMTILYHYANTLKHLVVGSSNKTELLMGYFTKYGDGGVDIMPLADLYKTQVRQLARYLKIPREIIEKTPTAGLWPGQSDEAELGIKYEILDLILSFWEKGADIKEIAVNMEIEPSKVGIVLDRVRINEHKRRLPLILRLSSVQG